MCPVQSVTYVSGRSEGSNPFPMRQLGRTAALGRAVELAVCSDCCAVRSFSARTLL